MKNKIGRNKGFSKEQIEKNQNFSKNQNKKDQELVNEMKELNGRDIWGIF